MILSGLEIERRLGQDIVILPYNPVQLNPNSYNLRLCNDLYVYEGALSNPSFELDMKQSHKLEKLIFPPEGIVLQPGILYLGRTEEYTTTKGLVPMLEGRSSVGRLGISVHTTAGFGDVGFSGFWTLEISCIHPVRIYPLVEICQIYFLEITSPFREYGSQGKYQDNKGIQPRLLYKELNFERKTVAFSRL